MCSTKKYKNVYFSIFRSLFLVYTSSLHHRDQDVKPGPDFLFVGNG